MTYRCQRIHVHFTDATGRRRHQLRFCGVVRAGGRVVMLMMVGGFR